MVQRSSPCRRHSGRLPRECPPPWSMRHWSRGQSDVICMEVPGEGATGMVTVTSPSTQITWNPEERLAGVRYTRGITLTSKDGDFLVESLKGWIGANGLPFAVFADAEGLQGTDVEYRAKASGFFR